MSFRPKDEIKKIKVVTCAKDLRSLCKVEYAVGENGEKILFLRSRRDFIALKSLKKHKNELDGKVYYTGFFRTHFKDCIYYKEGRFSSVKTINTSNLRCSNGVHLANLSWIITYASQRCFAVVLVPRGSIVNYFRASFVASFKFRVNRCFVLKIFKNKVFLTEPSSEEIKSNHSVKEALNNFYSKRRRCSSLSSKLSVLGAIRE